MSDYSKGSAAAIQNDVNAILESLAPGSYVDDEYDHFLLLDLSEAQPLLAKYWDRSYINYGFDSPDFPLCYDFAELCAAKMREGAIRENLKYRPAFGTLRYTQSNLVPETDENGKETGQMVNSRHAICFIVTAQLQVKYYEPQNGEWMDQPNDCKSLDNFEI